MTSLYAGDCVQLLMHVIRCVCVWNFGTILLRGGECKTWEKNSIFLKNGKTVISVEKLEFF